MALVHLLFSSFIVSKNQDIVKFAIDALALVAVDKSKAS